jgi:hypothetical protein
VSKTGRVDLAKYGCGLDRLSRAARRGAGGEK